MRIADNTLRIISFIIILVFCCWGCHEDPLDKPGEEKLRPGQLTVEEAYDLFREYAGNTVSRSVEAQPINLDPGIITAAWDDAALSTTPVNSFVNVPIRVTDTYLVKSPYNKDWVSVSQKLVIVQEDATRRHNIYLLSLFPEGDFATRHRNDISGLCQAGQMPEDFSGLAVYTKTRGGLPVHVGVYREGRLTKDVFLFDKRFSFEENLDRMNSLLRGYSLKTCNMALSRSFSESGGGSGSGSGGTGSGSGGSGGNWQFHTEGGSFQQDGYTCWNSTDSNGNHYVVADMNGDGKPDTILGGGTDVGEGSGGTGGSTNPGGGTTPGGGDINPGEGTNPGTGTGGGNNDDESKKVGPQGQLSKAIFSDDSKLTQEQWKKIEDALEKINKDCMGGKLVGVSKNKKIHLVHDESLKKAYGKYNYSKNTLTIRGLEEKNLHESVERTLLHELTHSAQKYNSSNGLNREVEVHFAVFRYSVRNKGRIPITGEKYNSMPILNDTMDKNYKIVDQNSYNQGYQKIISDLRNNGYQTYTESESSRNFDTVKELSKDC